MYTLNNYNIFFRLGEACSHVGGLLFKVEMSIRNGLRNVACTDVACKWNEVTWNGVKPDALAAIDLYAEEAKAKLKKGVLRRPSPVVTDCPDTIEEGLKMLIACESSLMVGLHLHTSTAINYVTPPPTKPATKKTPADLSRWPSNPPEDPTAALSAITEDEITYLEASTRDQASSLLWHELRYGRITGSKVGMVLRTNPDRPAPSILKDITSLNPAPINTPAIRWGQDHEPVAIQEYAESMSDHGDFEVVKSGLWVSVTDPHLGASPDGLVRCSCCGDGILEVKCPFTLQDSTIGEATLRKDFCLDSQLKLKTTHKYHDQVQLQLFVTGRGYCDFVVWSPSNMHITRVLVDVHWQQSSLTVLRQFWMCHVLPAILDGGKDDGLGETKSPDTPSHHCMCGEEDGGSMIGCDNADCPHEWFHWSCVGVTKAPKKRTWFCPECAQQTKRRKKN